jgi:hypothetical protein
VISLKWNDSTEAVRPKKLASSRPQWANLGHRNTTVQGFGIPKCGGHEEREQTDKTAKAHQLNKS